MRSRIILGDNICYSTHQKRRAEHTQVTVETSEQAIESNEENEWVNSRKSDLRNTKYVDYADTVMQRSNLTPRAVASSELFRGDLHGIDDWRHLYVWTVEVEPIGLWRAPRRRGLTCNTAFLVSFTHVRFTEILSINICG